MESSVTQPHHSDTIDRESKSDVEKVNYEAHNGPLVGEVIDETRNLEQQKTREGDAHFHRLGWKRLTIVLIVEAIALGSLGLPAAFATLGMVAGVILTIVIGLVAIYASYLIGEVKLKYPEVAHYADIGRLMFGKRGYWIFSAIFTSQLALVVGSHVLTGTIALANISRSTMCAVIFSVIAAIILFLLAIPPSFTEIAILGYIDFASIILAIGVTMVATGIKANDPSNALSSAPWSAWPKENVTFAEAIIALNSIVFAYAFASAMPSFMEEMHTPKDYVKSIWSLGLIEIFIYTLTGAIIYAFVGQDVKSPALLSAGPLISRIVFGLAIPVIFISGSINNTVLCRYVHGNMYKNSVVRYVNTRKGWTTWIALNAVTTLIAWIIAEAIPFFSELLSISASLFVSGLSFYIPPMMWYMLLKDGKWYQRSNLWSAVLSAITFAFGVFVLVSGTYASVLELVSPQISKVVNSFKRTNRFCSRSISFSAVRSTDHFPALPNRAAPI